MEALVKVVSELHKQWGIDCKPKDFTLAVARLLQIGVIDQAVDILHPEVWAKCTTALAEETMSSGCGKNLKSWGKVKQALQKAMQEQDTWKAARDCLLVTPKLGVGAATQTPRPPDDGTFTESKDSREGAMPPDSQNPDSLAVGQNRAKSFWGGLVEEAKSAVEKSEPKDAWARPPPYAPQDGAERQGEGRGKDAPCGNKEEALALTSTDKQGGEGSASTGRTANQNDRPEICPCKAHAPPTDRRGEQRGAGMPACKGSGRGRSPKRARPPCGACKGSGQSQSPRSGRGRSPVKKLRSPEAASQSSSDSESDTGWEEWVTAGLDSEENDTCETCIYRLNSQVIPTHTNKTPKKKNTSFTDWKQIKTACAEWVPPTTLAFPVRVTDGGQSIFSPVNPKDIQAIVKAIADKGLNSAMVSTLIDGVFGGDDMLPFDIRLHCNSLVSVCSNCYRGFTNIP
ncbi:uncharacterized protein AAGF69_006498 [Amazona ochrocephala]